MAVPEVAERLLDPMAPEFLWLLVSGGPFEVPEGLLTDLLWRHRFYKGSIGFLKEFP